MLPPGDFAGVAEGDEKARVLCEGCGVILVDNAGNRVPEPILVHAFHQAPEELRRLSGHGGDEDWLAEIPPHVEIPDWMNSGTPFGRCDTSEHDHPTLYGWKVVIGAHA